MLSGSHIYVILVGDCHQGGELVGLYSCPTPIKGELETVSVIFKYSLVSPRLTLKFCLNASLCSHLRECSTRKKKKQTEKTCWFFSLLKSSLKWCSERKDCLGERTSTKPTVESQIPTFISLLLPHEILSRAEVMGRQSQVIEFLMLNQLLFISWTTEAKTSIFHVHRDRKKKISSLKLPSRSTPKGN